MGSSKVPSVVDFMVTECSESIFKANNPFVSVFEQSTEGTRILKGDKVCDGKRMDSAALAQAIRTLTDSCARGSDFSTEDRGQICRWLSLDLWMLTKPSSPSKTLEVSDISELLERDGGDDEPADLVIQSLDDEDEYPASLKLLVRNPKVSAGLNNLVTVMIVEVSSASVTKENIYHGSSCASKAAIDNVKKGIYDPVLIEAWGECSWMYGILFPTGVATVTNGGVSHVRRSTAPSARVQPRPGGDPASSETPHRSNELSILDGILSSALKRMRKEFEETAPDEYPDGEYVIGTLFVSHKKFYLPNLKTAGSGALPDSKLFFQTLLRVVVGDRVLSWKPEDVNNAVRERRRVVEKIKDDFLSV